MEGSVGMMETGSTTLMMVRMSPLDKALFF